jgi:TetR/AcrR family transcriptional regulator, tetracycline repressor protein
MTEPTARASISKHAVIDGALSLADRDGLGELTIRKLATQVGVSPMSLYTHFGSKEQLFDLMFDRLVQRLFPPHGGSTWQREFETAGRHARSVLLAHPHWIPLLTRPVVPTSSLGFYDHLLRLMVEDGFPKDAAVHAFSSAMSLALGFVLTERMMTPRHGMVVPLRRLLLLKEAIPHFPPGIHRHIASANSAFDTWSFDQVFDLGLRSLIAGIELSFARSPPKARKRRRAAG